MPVTWDEKMHKLLLTLIVTQQNITINYQKLVDNWPDNMGEKPTPRAIREHLSKLTKNLAEQMAGEATGSNKTEKPAKATKAASKRKKATTATASLPKTKKAKTTAGAVDESNLGYGSGTGGLVNTNEVQEDDKDGEWELDGNHNPYLMSTNEHPYLSGFNANAQYNSPYQ